MLLPDGSPVTVIDLDGPLRRLYNVMRIPRVEANRIGAAGQVRWPGVDGEHHRTLLVWQEGTYWARGHGADVEAALLLMRSASAT